MTQASARSRVGRARKQAHSRRYTVMQAGLALALMMLRTEAALPTLRPIQARQFGHG